MSSSRPVITSSRHFVGKTGDGIISFGSGQPDLPPPPEAFQVLPGYQDFKYGLIQGQDNLREVLASQYPSSSPDEFVITNGASEALDLVLRALQRLGARKVYLPKPYYYSYPFNVLYAGMEIVYYPLEKGKIDLEAFFRHLDQVDVVLINSPANPTGSVQEIDVLQKIEAACQERKLWVISDEVYKDLIYERENYLIAGPRVVTINSFSKTYAMCGFRVGYLYARDRRLVEEVVEMKTHTSMNTNILGQEMAYAAAKVPQETIQKQVAIWKQRRDTIVSGLRALGLDLWKPEGAFYVLPRIPDSQRAINDLYYDHKLIAYDGAWFGAPDRVRFSYALDIDKIEEGLARLKRYLASRGLGG